MRRDLVGKVSKKIMGTHSLFYQLYHFVRTDNRNAFCKSMHLAVCQFIWVKDGKDKRQTPVGAALARYQKEQGITFTHTLVPQINQITFAQSSSHFRSSRTYPRLSRAHWMARVLFSSDLTGNFSGVSGPHLTQSTPVKWCWCRFKPMMTAPSLDRHWALRSHSPLTTASWPSRGGRRRRRWRWRPSWPASLAARSGIGSRRFHDRRFSNFALNRETYVQEHSSLDVRVDVEHLVEIDFDVLLVRKTALVFLRPMYGIQLY